MNLTEVPLPLRSYSLTDQAAVVKQGNAVFGQSITPHPDSDIKLKSSTGIILGDVDTLLTGTSLHVLVERKRQHVSELDAAAIIFQMKQTRRRICCCGATSSKGVGSLPLECRVEQVIFSQSMEPAAIRQFHEAGIYVLSFADKLLLVPP